MTTAADATQQGAIDESQIEAQRAAEEQAQKDADAEAAKTAEEERLKVEEDAARARARDPRGAMVDEIATRRNDALRAEGVVVDVEEAEAAADAAAEVKRKELEDAAAAEAAEEAERQKQLAAQSGDVITDAKKKVKVTVDGVESEVPIEDLIRTHQKHGSADYRLQQATDTLKRAEAALMAAANKDKKVEKETPTETVEQRIKKATDLMLDNDVDAAAKIFSEVITEVQGRDATPKTEDITAQVLHQVRMEQVLTGFKKEFHDLVGDKVLSLAVDREFQERYPKNEKGELAPISPEDFDRHLRDSAAAVIKWRDDKVGKKDPPKDAKDPAAERAAKREKKEDLDQTTGAHLRTPSSQAAASAEPSREERSSAIGDIAKARGQRI